MHTHEMIGTTWDLGPMDYLDVELPPFIAYAQDGFHLSVGVLENDGISAKLMLAGTRDALHLFFRDFLCLDDRSTEWYLRSHLVVFGTLVGAVAPYVGAHRS